MESKIQIYSKKIAYIILILSSIFAMYTSGFGLFSAMPQRSIHWMFMGACIFLLFPFKKKGKITIVDVIFSILLAITTMYVILTWEKNALRLAEPKIWETIISIIGILLVLEATRRSLGAAMPIIAIIAIAYAYFGPYFPGMIKHKGYSITNLVSFLFTTTEGIFGLAMGVSATYIIIFVLFGSFLAKSGAGQLFVDLSLTSTGKYRSGPAQATILSNALMGIISGSPVANVVTVGSFTLPLLDSAKYPKVRGAALLAVAATGSMFTPPVMGAGAFLIADYLSVSYGKVIMAAIIPAALFYISVVVYADVTAEKAGLVGLKKEELPDWKGAIKGKGLLLIPIILLVGLIIYGWSPLKSAFWCVILIFVLSSVKRSTHMSLDSIKSALIAGSKDTLTVAAACACAGIIVGVVSGTGIGVKFSSFLIQLADKSVMLTLVFTMIACIIMGMGLPPTAVYIIMAALTAPALIEIGVSPMSAHFFIFYFSCIGAITPPVALAAYSSAAIAKTDPFKTGWTAFRMGLVAYIVPYIFAYNPILLLQGGNGVLATTITIITACVGVVFLTFGIEGYFHENLNIISRLLFFVGALGMMIPGITSDIIGIVMIIVGYILIKYIKPKKAHATSDLQKL